MDLTLFKRDIDELINEFSEDGLTTLADMKRVWLSRKFSFIYEAKPAYNLAFFMQSLYAHSINDTRALLECCFKAILGHMVSTGSLSQRLGGLYCLYCLYETQPFKPPFKIYLSLGELSKLRNIVIDAKQNGIGVLPVLVKRMLERNMFLFGSVDIDDSSVTERVDEITKLQNARIQFAYKTLFANTRIDARLQMDLGEELDLKELEKMSTEYAKAKELAVQEASAVVGIDDIKHIAQNKNLIGDVVRKISDEWDAQKEVFHQQTGVKRPHEEAATDEFDRELEHLLTDC